jgi:hypothetical protein
MERRVGPRVRTKIDVISSSVWGVERLEAVAISASGMVVRQSGPTTLMQRGMVHALELELPERSKRLSVRARPVRSFGEFEALRFVEIDDADRLNIAEHLDLLNVAGQLDFDLGDGLGPEDQDSASVSLFWARDA